MKAGDSVDRYQLLKKLGHGGMGGVWIAFDPDANDLVAVKTLFEEYTEDELYVRRFQREIDLLSKLRHPNIVGFRGSGSTDRTYYVALEYIRGSDIADLLKEHGRFHVADALPLITGVSRGIGHAHGMGVIHRDIKPSNIMVSTEGRIAKILDFGVAHAEDAHLMTATGDVVGTFLYSSPEQNQGKQVDERSDIYALGLTFHEMLTGDRVLKGTNHQEVTAQQLTSQIPPPSSLNPAVPQHLDRILAKMLEIEADKRYQSMDELLMDLETFQNNPQEFSQDRRSIYEFPDLVPEFKQAQKAQKDQRYDDAIELISGLIGKAPRAAELHVLMGQCQRDKGLPFNAVNAFKRAITFERGNIAHHLELATTYEEMGMEKAAIETYETILLIEPNSTKARERMGTLRAGGTPGRTSSPGGSVASGIEDLNKGFNEAREAKRRSLHGEVALQATPEMVAAVEGAQSSPPPSVRPEGEELSAAKEALDLARPALLDVRKAVVGTFLLWPTGSMMLGHYPAAIALLAVEGALVGGAVFFHSNPGWVGPLQAMQDWAISNPGLSAWYGKLLCGILWLVGGVWLAFEAQAGVRVHNQQAYVVDLDPAEQTVLVNAGSRAGFAKGDRLLVYQEKDHSFGAGVLIGEVKLVEVLDQESAGRFYSSGEGAVRVGDYVTSVAAVHEGWVDPTKPAAGRFPALG